MLSLAKFHVKCRFCLQNTVSASKRSKDWKMRSLAKFHIKRLPCLDNIFLAPATIKHWKAQFSRISRETSTLTRKEILNSWKMKTLENSQLSGLLREM